MIASFAAVLASGCQSNSCDGFRPMRPTANDVQVISTRLAGAILSHNDYGARLCGWTK